MHPSPSTSLCLTIILCLSSGCRLAYEILPAESNDIDTGDGDGDFVFGGTSGDGDGDGDSSTWTGGTPGVGGSSGGSTSGGADSGGNGSTGGDGAGGTSSGGSASGGSSSGGAGSGGSSAELTVNTSADENDFGATAAEPKGTGLSFREALTIANGMTSSTIGFTNGLVVQINADLPVLAATTNIVGNGATLDFSGRVSTNQCWAISGGTVVIDGLTLSGCSQQSLLISGGSSHQITRSDFVNQEKPLTTTQSSSGTTIGPGNYFTGSSGGAVFVGGSNDVIVDNHFEDLGANAISVSSTGDGALILGNLFVRTYAGVFFSNNADNVDIWHNTFVSTVTSAVVTGMAVGIDIRNNIFTHSGQYGLDADSTDLSANDYNLFFANAGHCSNCSGLGSNSKIQDPLYINFASDDFTLGVGSPCIDAGTGLGFDRNGASAGTFNGSAPDVGYSESN